DAWVDNPLIDEDEVILKEENSELTNEFQNVNKRVTTIFDRERMEATIKDMISNQFKDVEEYAYHLEQAQNYMENQIADFKYLNKNDIEDMYYLWLNNKNYHENTLRNSLLIFIRSCVIWERVHDFQLGIESYHIMINLTAPTLTFLGIEACNPFSIIDKPTVGLIYLNNKKEKRFIDLEEIPKFCDDTLEKVLKEVKMKIFESEFKKKTRLHGKLDVKIMKAYEREIVKRLQFHK
ncbi:hypothetical protein Tco_0741516, partial [Tanacetum coccineum]